MGEMEANMDGRKRKRIKKKPSKDDDSSSDDAEERQRGANNLLFGNPSAKKFKKNDGFSSKDSSQEFSGQFGDNSQEVEPRKRKIGSKPLGRPKMRNPDGTL